MAMVDLAIEPAPAPATPPALLFIKQLANVALFITYSSKYLALLSSLAACSNARNCMSLSLVSRNLRKTGSGSHPTLPTFLWVTHSTHFQSAAPSLSLVLLEVPVPASVSDLTPAVLPAPTFIFSRSRRPSSLSERNIGAKLLTGLVLNTSFRLRW